MKRRIQKYISVFVLSALLLAAGYGEAKKCHGDRTLVLFRHQEQYEDIEKELCYTQFRYYSSQMGMYISSDPIGQEGNNPTLHGYVPDVNTWLDVFGLDIIKVNPSDPFPKSEKGKTWKEKFIERFNDKRNIEAGGIVSPTGFKSKPTLACK